MGRTQELRGRAGEDRVADARVRCDETQATRCANVSPSNTALPFKLCRRDLCLLRQVIFSLELTLQRVDGNNARVCHDRLRVRDELLRALRQTCILLGSCWSF